MTLPTLWLIEACAIGAITLGGCCSVKAPAMADVAVSRASTEGNSTASGTETAPRDLRTAREKLALSKQALAAIDYKTARDYVKQAQFDAKLAYAKAETARGRAVTAMLLEDIRAQRVALERASAPDSISRSMP